MWPAAAPLVMCMHGYTEGVAIARYYLYPLTDLAASLFTKTSTAMTKCVND